MTNSLQRCQPLLGTYVEVSLCGDFSDNELIRHSNNVFDELARIHQIMGFHDPMSELSALNRRLATKQGVEIILSSDFCNVIGLALTLFERSSGLFDVTIAPYLVAANLLPNHLTLERMDFGDSSDLTLSDNRLCCTKPVCIDLGGIAKGYAVDCAIAVLPEGIDATINAGGDMRSTHWLDKQVLLKYGARASAVKKSLMLNQALATSAGYYHQNNSPLINPILKKNHAQAGSVSVFASTAMLSDALTKVVSLMPTAAAKEFVASFDASVVKISRFGFKTVY